MRPEEHLRWFRQNIDYFESIQPEQLDVPVPTCPEWQLVDLLNHMSFGLGVCYPIAASTAPDTPVDRVFAEADRSSMAKVGRDALSAFLANIRKCADSLASIDPNAPCWTYAGPGTAAFWSRRAAVETTIHRFDAEFALGDDVDHLVPDRVDDAIDETLTFAFELACAKVGSPPSTIHLRPTDGASARSFDVGDRSCTIIGEGHALLLALWGRYQHVDVHVEGAADAAQEWLTLVSRAFAGR